MYSLEELRAEADIMVSAFMLPYKKVKLGSNIPELIDIHELGVLIICIEPLDYSFVMQKLLDKYKGYRFIVLTCDDNLITKKDEILWEFMRSGYLRYLRYKYVRQFNNLIQQGFGRKIIIERLRLWGDDPKYKFLVEENKRCLNISSAYLVAQDPAFFDFMPEDPAINIQGDKLCTAQMVE